MATDMQLLGRVIRDYRKIKGLSQVQLASKAGLHVNTLGAYELGKGNPRRGMLRKLEKALGIPLGQLRIELEHSRILEQYHHRERRLA